jgi:transposase
MSNPEYYRFATKREWRHESEHGVRPRTVGVREGLNAILYMLWTGCQWKALPNDLPPRSTVWDFLDRWAVGCHA